MMKKRTILTRDPMHCSQANALFGKTKTTRQMTKNIETMGISEGLWVGCRITYVVRPVGPRLLPSSRLGRQRIRLQRRKRQSNLEQVSRVYTQTVKETTNQTIRQNQLQKQETGRPIDRHNRCNCRMWGRQPSFHPESGDWPTLHCRPLNMRGTWCRVHRWPRPCRWR